MAALRHRNFRLLFAGRAISFFGTNVVPVGYAIAGPFADAIGVRATLWGAAAVGVAVTLAVLAVRDVRTLERATPTPSPASGDP